MKTSVAFLNPAALHIVKDAFTFEQHFAGAVYKCVFVSFLAVSVVD